MKNKKVGTILLAVVCFFVGFGIFTEFPTVGALTLLFEAIACYLCGLWANKPDAEFVDSLAEENEDLTEELAKANAEIEELNKAIKEFKKEQAPKEEKVTKKRGR
jgi:peptidoglycan hydrolase CwlO-like protein